MIAPSSFNRQYDFCDRFQAWFGAEISLAVDADAHGIGFHVALSDHEHPVDFHLFGAVDLPLMLSVLLSISARTLECAILVFAR
jgi:hypothetical protein